jgi:hypothetical protein
VPTEDGSYPELSAMLERTTAWLEQNGARDEALGRFERKRGLFGLGGGMVLVPVGRVWRLGVLLLDRELRLFSAGAVTRAVEPGRPNYQSVSGERRREIRRAALQSGFSAGEVVNYDAAELALDEGSLHAGSGPLLLADGIVTVRWAAGQGRVPLAGYLRERAHLLARQDGWDEAAATP